MPPKMFAGFVCCVVAVLLLFGAVFATTLKTITVDGVLDEWAADEVLPADSASDSLYGLNNELSRARASWNRNTFFLSFDYRAWGTAVMYLLETGNPDGVSDFCAPAYQGAFPANVKGPAFDLMVAFFATDSATVPVARVYALEKNGSRDLANLAGVQIKLVDIVDVSKATHVGVVEVGIPWDVIYGHGLGKVPVGSVLQLVGVVRGKLDNDGLGDVHPDPSTAVRIESCGSGKVTTIDRTIKQTVDADRDGLADGDWSPASNASTRPDAAPDRGADQGRPDARLADGARIDGVLDFGAPREARSISDGTRFSDRQSQRDGTGAHDVKGTASTSNDEGCACAARASSSRQYEALFAVVVLGCGLCRRRRR